MSFLEIVLSIILLSLTTLLPAYSVYYREIKVIRKKYKRKKINKREGDVK